MDITIVGKYLSTPKTTTTPIAPVRGDHRPPNGMPTT